MKNKIKQNKKAMEVQSIFYIFMSLIMIAIIVFGLKQVTSVSEQISDSERVEIQKELKAKIEACEDPLNRGNIEYIELQNQKFNAICFLGKDYKTSIKLQSSLNDFDEIIAIGDSGDNVILLKVEFIKSNIGNNITTKNQIISSFEIQGDLPSFCNFPTEDTNDFNFKLKCE
jgi:hypothetical protein